MKSIVLAALALLLIPLSSGVAQEKNGLKCKLVLSIDTAFLDRWDHANLPHLSITATDHVVRGEVFGVYPQFTGCALDKNGDVHVTIDLRITRPDGKTYFEEKDVKALDESGGDGKNLLLPRDIRFVSFDAPDLLGTYTSHLEAHDLVAKTTITAEDSIELVDYKPGAGFTSAEELNSWFGTYSDKPEPQRLIPALHDFAQGAWSKDNDSGRGSLRELFEANQWAFPLLIETFPKADAAMRELVLWLLARSTYKCEAFVKTLKQNDLAVWERISASSDPLTEPITGREDMNELWGMVVPRRSYAPLLRLCLSLAPDETGVVADSTVHDKQTGGDVPLAQVVKLVAPSIVGRGIKWDPIVRAYCENMQANEKLPAGVRDALEKLLAEH